MKFYFERSSQAALIIGFLLITGLIGNLYSAFEEERARQEQIREDLSLQLEKITLLTNVFEAMNQLNNTLESAIIIDEPKELKLVFNRADQLRGTIAENRDELQKLLFHESDSHFLSAHGEVTIKGLASQKYYESLLVDFNDKESALNVLTAEVTVAQEKSIGILSDYYEVFKQQITSLLTQLTLENTQKTEQFQQKMALTFLIMSAIALLVLWVEVRHNRIMQHQRNLLREQNDSLEKTVATRTAKLEEATQEAILANNAKSDFLATMSHEIRTPLNGVIGTLNLIEHENLSTENKKLVHTAKESSELLLTIISDILDYSKIEAGKFELINQPFSVDQLINSVESTFMPLTNAKGIAFEVNKEGVHLPYIKGDRIRISQILNNYLNNALKFTSQGKITLNVTTDDTGLLCLSVTDTGIGISAENVSKLFKDFSQVNTGASRRFQGTGLGLAICKKLAELMGGSVSVISEPEKGSTFSAQLQLEPANESEFLKELEITESVETFGVSHDQINLLLVEDNLVNQMVAKKILEKEQYRVTIANNGKECLEKFDSQELPFDLVLMDCQMPIMDGFEASRQLRLRNVEVPIIALTANAQASDKDACYESGMSDFISKPFKPENLIEVIDKNLRNHKIS